MLESYKIVKTKNDEILYLYLNVNYEFANDLARSDLEKKAINYLNTYNIKFNGNKVVYVINGINSKVIDLNNNKLYKNNRVINLSKNEKITIKELLLSLLFTNIHLTLKEETLKALTVLYRSEIISNLINDNLNLENINLDYHNYNYYKLTYPETFKIRFKLYSKVIDETDSEYLIYENRPIKCYTQLVSNGYIDPDGIPYIRKTESLFDLTYPNYMQNISIPLKEFKSKLNINDDNINIKIINNNNNKIQKLIINEKELSVPFIASCLNLPSTDMTIIIKNDHITFITRGIGMGRGLSIIGANNLADLNCNYKQILNYYFQKVKLITKKN